MAGDEYRGTGRNHSMTMNSASTATLERGRKLASASCLKDLTLLLLDEHERELAELRAENVGLRNALRKQQQPKHHGQQQPYGRLQLADYPASSTDEHTWQVQGLGKQFLQASSAQMTSGQFLPMEDSGPWDAGDGDGGAGKRLPDSYAPLEQGLKAAADAAAGAPLAPCTRPSVRTQRISENNKRWLRLPGQLGADDTVIDHHGDIRGPTTVVNPPKPTTGSCMILKLEKVESDLDWGLSDIDSSEDFHSQGDMITFDPTCYSPASRFLLKKGLMTNLLSACFHCWVKETKRMVLLNEPLHFNFKPVWAKCDVSGDLRNPAVLASARSQSCLSEVEEMKEEHDLSLYEMNDDADKRVVGDAPCGVLVPSGKARIVWDVLGAFLLCFDVILIPLLSFDIGRSSFVHGFDWTTLFFWTFDMVMSMSTGYVHQGVTEMRRHMILWNYVRGWMWLDLVVVGPDWVCTIAAMANDSANIDGSSANTSRLLRILRMLRLARLLRLVKLRRIFAMIRDRIDSEFMFIIANIVQLIIMLLVVNHFLASIWFAIGDFSRRSGGNSWIEDSEFQLGSVTVGYQYTTSLHWSLTQFTPASMSVQPTNTLERTFAIAVLVSGFVLFSSFVSSITASMTQLRSMQDKVSQQIWLLRRYLRQRGIKPQLTFRILRYVEWKCSEQRDLVSESRLHVLGLLSEQLRSELQYSVSFSCLMGHPLLEQISNVSSVLIHRLAATACSQKSLATEDVLISTGTEATHMYMVVSGELVYRSLDEEDYTTIEERLQKDDWLCEHALWTQWHHIGTVEALNESKLVGIDASVFAKVIVAERHSLELVSAYGTEFMNWLNACPRKDLSDAFLVSEMRDIVQQFTEGDPNTPGKSAQRLSLRRKGTPLLRSATRSLARTAFL